MNGIALIFRKMTNAITGTIDFHVSNLFNATPLVFGQPVDISDTNSVYTTHIHGVQRWGFSYKNVKTNSTGASFNVSREFFLSCYWYIYNQ